MIGSSNGSQSGWDAVLSSYTFVPVVLVTGRCTQHFAFDRHVNIIQETNMVLDKGRQYGQFQTLMRTLMFR
jgi:hypothetical protein